MNNVSSLFENLMTYSEVNKSNVSSSKKVIKKSKKIMKENDATLLNLTVEIPDELKDVTPDDIKVDVGVMNVDNSDVESETDDVDEISVDDDTLDEPIDNKDSKDEDEDKKDKDKKESINLRRKAIHKKVMEAKAAKQGVQCTGKEDCQCEKCKTKKESVSDEEVDLALKNIRKRTVTETKCKESLMHLDTKSLNKLITEFVKENYKNIDKVVINKAVLENKTLKIMGKIVNESKETSTFSITNRGFNATKLEGKRFLMDFKDTSNTFNVIKESLKQPFLFTCTLKNGVLKFENLKYSFKTKMNESVALVSGKCSLAESVSMKKNITESNFRKLKRR